MFSSELTIDLLEPEMTRTCEENSAILIHAIIRSEEELHVSEKDLSVYLITNGTEIFKDKVIADVGQPWNTIIESVRRVKFIVKMSIAPYRTGVYRIYLRQNYTVLHSQKFIITVISEFDEFRLISFFSEISLDRLEKQVTFRSFQ